MADGETKTKLLKNIYMQSDNTIRKNDIIFKKICEYIPKDINIIYKSTSLCR